MILPSGYRALAKLDAQHTRRWHIITMFWLPLADDRRLGWMELHDNIIIDATWMILRGRRLLHRYA